jgi:hypothetical protein
MAERNEYTKEQYAALTYSNEQFDKNVTFIASGALGISFAFIEKIVKLENAHCKCWLIVSWYIFAIVIFISLLTHFISILANRWSIENRCDEDSSDKEKKEYDFIAKCWNYSIRGLNILMLGGLLIGMIYLISFIKDNI